MVAQCFVETVYLTNSLVKGQTFNYKQFHFDIIATCTNESLTACPFVSSRPSGCLKMGFHTFFYPSTVCVGVVSCLMLQEQPGTRSTLKTKTTSELILKELPQ